AEGNDLEPAWPESATDEGLLGVVVSLDGDEAARVAFAPGRDARVTLESVTWARPAGDEHRFEKIKKIAQVFSPGDVARFRVFEEEDGVRAELFQAPEGQAALISFEIDGGEVRALVGGYDFEASEFDRATQARRQPGSAFKPLVYAAAMEAGLTPASIVTDRPVVFDDPESGTAWRPENYGRRFLGDITLRESLARSVNNASIHLLQEVGVRRARKLARRLGIDSPIEANLGMALGVSPVTLLEITRAYAVFAAGGQLVEPIFVLRVLDRDGNVLVDRLALDETRAAPRVLLDLDGEPLPSDAEPAVSPTQAYLAAGLLRDVVEHPRGTGRRARALGHAVGGKTGTTNDGGDAWFVGFTPDVATGVWVGFDEKRVLGRGETGGRAALPIWIDFMQSALAEHPRRELEVPEGIVFARIDAGTGELATAASADTVMQAFAEGSEPKRRGLRPRPAPGEERVSIGDL
ncbi:MAG: penicillin-binding transpeptidase domain-containing protein, partial [Myxococcota bacterium]|nr:penicillin-binding transpeptidase domain-containing protein [Myxococcota bacterium]